MSTDPRALSRRWVEQMRNGGAELAHERGSKGFVEYSVATTPV